MTNDKICREVVYCDECNKRIKKGSLVYWYDYVMLGLDYKRTIARRFFCTIGCAKHHFQNSALVVNDTSKDASDVDWQVEEV